MCRIRCAALTLTLALCACGGEEPESEEAVLLDPCGTVEITSLSAAGTGWTDRGAPVGSADTVPWGGVNILRVGVASRGAFDPSCLSVSARRGGELSFVASGFVAPASEIELRLTRPIGADQVVVRAASRSLTARSARTIYILPGDVNNDAMVTRGDIGALTASYASRVVPGVPFRADLNNDGAVNLADLAVLQASLGATLPGPGGCGDGILDPGEECDSASGVPSSDCTEGCMIRRWSTEHGAFPDDVNETAHFGTDYHVENQLLITQGDVTQDWRFDQSDRDLLAAHVADPTTVVPCAAAGDVNRDGVIDAADVTEMDAWLTVMATFAPGDVVDMPMLPPDGTLACDAPVGLLQTLSVASPGTSLPIVLLGGRDSTNTTFEVISGSATMRPATSVTAPGGVATGQVHYIDVDSSALEGERIEIGVSLPDLGLELHTAIYVAASVAAGESGGAAGGGAAPVTDAGTPDAGLPEDCPQRGFGCCALVLDFTLEAEYWGPGDMDDELESLSCTVNSWKARDHGVRARRQEAIRWVKPPFSLFPIPWGTTPGETLAEFRLAMAPAVTALNRAIDAHRACITNEDPTTGEPRGREAVYEVISGHGSHRLDDDETSCGQWLTMASGADRGGVRLFRRTFIGTQYGLMRNRVCGHLIFDGTCFSGMTVAGYEAANNTGTAHCRTPRTNPIDHSFHAAFEENVALASSDYDHPALAVTVAWDLAQVEDLIEESRADGDGPDAYEYAEANRSEYAAYYIDDGYRWCDWHRLSNKVSWHTR